MNWTEIATEQEAIKTARIKYTFNVLMRIFLQNPKDKNRFRKKEKGISLYLKRI